MSGSSVTRYILQGTTPVPEPDLLTWAAWFETADRLVALDEIGDMRISTVFLGLDHNFFRGGAPALWETMVFGGPHDGYQERYATHAAAVAGHAKALALAAPMYDWRDRSTDRAAFEQTMTERGGRL